MFDVHLDLNAFYREHVRLDAETLRQLQEAREACLNRLKEGLQRLGEKRHQEFQSFLRARNQGSYAMHTLVQHKKREFDIDVAVIFEESALPRQSALRARQRVADALRATLANFSTKPLARANAVTVWYSRGFHVDLAVYREVSGFWGGIRLEHAGSKWRERDPESVNRWFADTVKELSPRTAEGATVKHSQLRRVVQWVKSFCRSRVSWNMPGGMILSKLVSEVYKPDPARDDVALYETLVALQGRLRRSLEVRSPIENLVLTRRPDFAGQVRTLLAKLDFVLPKLEILKSPVCLKHQALAAWGHVFDHPFWRRKVNEALLATRREPDTLRIHVGLSTEERGAIESSYRDERTVLPKETWVRFTLRKRLAKHLQVEPPFQVLWMTRNRGSEAKVVEDEVQEIQGNDAQIELWRRAAFQGRHTVTCEVRKDGHVIARGVRHIRVGAG